MNKKQTLMKTAALRRDYFVLAIFVAACGFVAFWMLMPNAFSQTASSGTVAVIQTLGTDSEKKNTYLQTPAELPPLTVNLPGRSASSSPVSALTAMESELGRVISIQAPLLPVMEAYGARAISQAITPDIKYFMEEILIPNEAKYFEPGLGMDETTGLPYDHIRYRLKSKIMTEVGNYTAASKLSLSIPFLLNIIQHKPGFASLEGWTAVDAQQKLKAVLLTLQKFNQDFPDYRGFLPWVDIRPNGTIAPANTKIPSLDNGQLTWALAAVVSVFENAQTGEAFEIKSLAEHLLAFQNYGHFYDKESGLLHGTIQVAHRDGRWVGDKTYYLNDMFEGTMAVLWAVLHGQVPEAAWNNLKIPTVDYKTMQGDQVTTFQGFRSSFHEWWALAYLPFMQSPLAPLFHNYLFVQADHAVKNKLPGFTSTAFDAQGVYRQMGIPEIAGQKVDRDDVSVVFGTAISMMISPSAGSLWLKNLYDRHGLVTPFGAVESMGPDGFADIFTADAKGMTLLAASGGMNHEIERYLKSHRYLDTQMTLYQKMMLLFQSKHDQMLKARAGRPVLMSRHAIPLPPADSIEPQYAKPPTPGEAFDVTRHFQAGHLHGKNVTSVGEETLEDDLNSGSVLEFDYEIPPHFIYFDQWAFRGTYLDKAVRIAEMSYLVVEVPASVSPSAYEIELKSDDITLASALVRTTDKGWVPQGSGTKTLVYPIHPIPESDYKALNYLSISLHDPRYANGPLKSYARQGQVVIKSIKLAKQHPFRSELSQNPAPAESYSEIPILKFWRLSHGDMPYKTNPWKGTLVFEGGRGWRGGYVPYSDVRKYKYLYLKIRNKSGTCNCLDLEMKHELSQLLGQKVSLVLNSSGKWQYFEIPIPQKNKRAFNYLAISDVLGKFEIGSAFLSQRPVSSFNAEKVDTSGKKTHLRCRYQCPAIPFN